MKYIKQNLKKYIKIFTFKKIVLGLFLIALFGNYFFGYRYQVILGDNLIYKNLYYPLILLWILLVWCWELSIDKLFKLAIIIYFFSVIYQLIDKRTVAEILISYSFIIFFTLIILSIKDIILGKK